ncbi:hypothetical protein E4U43_005277 [Claviceps pusilla]|uniref:Uncharacterized protein n=1 Tax=Claviceps pusilla TaxID=123648 RepID=A0A9P7NEQ5_9HYPO|nr:hypothetical protein E4U43_005277 [Claviceps pusilla]
MKFSKATSILFFCASAVSALRIPVAERRNYPDLADESSFKSPPGAHLDALDLDLDRREAFSEPDALPAAADEVHELVTRDPYDAEILEYLRDIETENIGGPAKWPLLWKDLHGDGKASSDGKFVCQVKHSGGVYEARVVAHKKLTNTIKTGHVFKTVHVPTGRDKKGHVVVPSYGRAVHFLRVAYGNA